VTVISNSVLQDVVVVQNVSLSEGWHTLDVFFSQGTSSVGPNVPGFTSGIMFDPANGPFTNATEIAAAARRFEDPGDGSLLRTFDLTGTNVVNARLELAQDGTFDRSATAASLVWAADVVAAANATGTPILTVSGGTEPFRMGATSRSAVFGTDISDPNGVVFQDRVWLLNTPDSSTWSILPGAEIAYGTPGVLTTGTLILTNFSARLPASDALGTGGETVTVAGVNNGVWFDATRESDGMLFDDPAYSFTASNNVVFTGTGAVAGFDGAGSVTYNGSISGSGTLVKNGTGDVVLSAASTFSGDVQVNAGRLLAGDDAQLGDSGNSVTVAGGMLGNASSVALTLDRDILVTSGGFDVQDASLNLSGVVSGTAEKQGAGTLVLEGASANTGLDLTVSQGDAVLNKSGVPAVENLTVSTGARAQLAGSGDNQIAGTVTLTGGILDLNGVDETINGLNRTDLASTVPIGGASSAVLTVGGEDADGTFFGSWADGSSLGLTKTGNGVFSMVGAIGSQTATGDLRVESGTVSLGIGLRYVRITPLETAGMWPAIGEFQLLRDGVPLAWPAGTTAAATSYTSSYPPENLIDSNSRSVWRAGAVAASIVIDFQGPLLFNGYRWYTGDVNQSDPVSWTVEVSADNTVWFMADTRTDQTIVANRSVLAGTYAFNGMWPGDAVSVNASAIVASNARLRAALPYESVAGLTGAGEVSLAGGARLRVADADTFTGSVSGDGQLLLGGHAALDVALLSDEVTVANDAAGPVVVTVGAKGESLFTGALTDGTAPLGLVKQGNDTLMLVDAGSTYTGDTKIEAGTLSVQSPVWNFRYVRFNPTQTVGGGVDSYGVPFSISEFQLMRNGQTVAYPAGKTVSTPYAAYNSSYTAAGAVNGLTGPTTTDRWLSTALPNPLTIDMKSGVQFDAYRWYTCSSVNDNHRAPNAWTVEGSNDGITWVQLDNQSDVAITPWVSGSGVEVGPFSLRSARYNLPGEYWAETNSMALKLAAVSARYLRFTPTAARVEDSTDSFGSSGFQLAEVPLNYPAGTTASAPGGSWLGYMFLPQRAVDNDISTTSANRWYSDAMVNPLTVDMTQQVAFDAYRWFTAYNTPTRDPISWTLEVSNNMTDWYTVDVQTNQSVPETRSAAAGLWALDIPAGQLATDAIPDDSRTIVMTSATLRIDAGSETIGPLSGTGTVFMAASGVLGLNWFEAADYAGDITGAGTVEKSGTETQTLSGTLSFSGAIIVDEGVLDLTGATLTGVTNIVIRSGGTLTGKATVNGDLTVTFEGGLYRADLAVSGALSVVGDMLLSMPNGVELPYAHRLFSFGSADTATRAAIQASQSSLTVPTGFMPAVRVTADAAYLTVSAPGTLLIIN
jgi:autotransporter-associated beta strand protein